MAHMLPCVCFTTAGSQQQHQHHQQRDMFPQNPGSVSRGAPISSAGFMSPSPALGGPRGVPPPPVSAAACGTAVPGGSVLRPAAPASSFGFTAPQSAPAPSNASTGNIGGGTGALGGAPGGSLAAPPGPLMTPGPGASGFGHAGGFPRLPPTGEGGHSPAPYSAPTVGAQPVKPGMPVPWPIPTAAQLVSLEQGQGLSTRKKQEGCSQTLRQGCFVSALQIENMHVRGECRGNEETETGRRIHRRSATRRGAEILTDREKSTKDVLSKS